MVIGFWNLVSVDAKERSIELKLLWCYGSSTKVRLEFGFKSFENSSRLFISGVTISGFSQYHYEFGVFWPKNDSKPKLDKIFYIDLELR